MDKAALKEKIQGIRTFNGRVMQPWQKRAMGGFGGHTAANESVRSGSGEHKGKEILFPTIRLRGPGLEKIEVKQAFKEALQRKDYLTFDTAPEATKYSIDFSNELGRRGDARAKEKARRPRPDNLRQGYLLK
jgi:hypothetical protein